MRETGKIINNVDELYAFRVFDKNIDPRTTATMFSWEEMCADYVRRYNSEEEGYQKARVRKVMEGTIRDAFIKKGGKPVNAYALYFSIGKSPLDYIMKGFKNPSYLKIPLSIFNESVVSFTYGNAAVAFFREDRHETTRKVYFMSEIIEIINKYGIDIIYRDRKSFVEMQLWDDLTDNYYDYICQ